MMTNLSTVNNDNNNNNNNKPSKNKEKTIIKKLNKYCDKRK